MDRGDVHRALGNLEMARSAFENALELAEKHKLGQFMIQAEKAIRALDAMASNAARKTERPAVSSFDGIEEIREALDRMRDLSPALAGV
jgi:hypothetical protein